MKPKGPMTDNQSRVLADAYLSGAVEQKLHYSTVRSLTQRGLMQKNERDDRLELTDAGFRAGRNIHTRRIAAANRRQSDDSRV